MRRKVMSSFSGLSSVVVAFNSTVGHPTTQKLHKVAPSGPRRVRYLDRLVVFFQRQTNETKNCTKSHHLAVLRCLFGRTYKSKLCGKFWECPVPFCFHYHSFVSSLGNPPFVE